MSSYAPDANIQTTQAKQISEVPIGYISRPINDLFRCEIHPDGCGRHLKPGALVLIDGSSCYYKDGQWLITASSVNVVGDPKDDSCGLRRSCRVGLVKVLCNQVNLFANRYAIVTKLKKNTSDDPKLLETSIERVESQTLDGKELPTEDPPNKRRKKSTGKPLSLKTLLSMIEEAAKKEVLANPNIATVDIVTANYDVAYVTLLDGGLTINQPRVQATLPALAVDHPDPLVDGAVELRDEDVSAEDNKESPRQNTRRVTRRTPSREAQLLLNENGGVTDDMGLMEARQLRRALKESAKSIENGSSESSSASSSSGYTD